MATTPAAKSAAKPASPKPDAAKAAPPKAGAKADQAALPDAALLDREAGDATETVAAPASGISRWLPRGPWRWVAIGVAFVVLAGGAAATALSVNRPPPKPTLIAGPAQAVSGATLVIAGETIQLDGIEAPPASLICRDGKWEYKCGEESRRALEQEIRGRTVECQRTAMANGTAATAQCHNDHGIDLAAALVEGGWAVIDFKRSSRYMPQQVRAQNENRGLWRNDFATSEQWRLAGSKSR
jgi:endonuclease YncB( thermonuclease family)